MRRDTLEYILSKIGINRDFKSYNPNISIELTHGKTIICKKNDIYMGHPVESGSKNYAASFLCIQEPFQHGSDKEEFKQYIDISSISTISIVPDIQSQDSLTVDFLNKGNIVANINVSDVKRQPIEVPPQMRVLSKTIKSMFEQAELGMTGLDYGKLDKTHEFIMAIRPKSKK